MRRWYLTDSRGHVFTMCILSVYGNSLQPLLPNISGENDLLTNICMRCTAPKQETFALALWFLGVQLS